MFTKEVYENDGTDEGISVDEYPLFWDINKDNEWICTVLSEEEADDLLKYLNK